MAPAGHERRAAMVLGFALCLAVGAAFIGRDGPLATAPMATAAMLSLPSGAPDATLFTFPDRLANEPLTNFDFAAVQVRGTQGLAAKVVSPGGVWVVTWTEGGTAYWLSSDRREIPDLVRLAGSLR